MCPNKDVKLKVFSPKYLKNKMLENIYNVVD